MRSGLIAMLACAGAAHAQTPDCALPNMNAAWQAGVAAFESGDWPAAATALDPVISACGAASNEAEPLRVLRAEIAVRQSDFARARDFIAGVPRPSQRSFGILGNWTALRAARGLGDMPAFNFERSLLLAASGDGLVRRGGHLRERVDLNGGVVSIYQTDLLQGSFRRRYIALYDKPDALPRTVALTLNTLVESMDANGAGDSYFIDAYFCAGHATLEILETSAGALPDYEAFRSRALTYFASDEEPEPTPDAQCAYIQYLTPDPLADG